MVVSLRAITAETVRQITNLSVSPEQQRFVASNAVSLAQALFSPDAWYRAIYADDSPAGFVMVYDESLRASPPVNPQVGLWRFMVDTQFQGQGIQQPPSHSGAAYRRLHLTQFHPVAP